MDEAEVGEGGKSKRVTNQGRKRPLCQKRLTARKVNLHKQNKRAYLGMNKIIVVSE